MDSIRFEGYLKNILQISQGVFFFSKIFFLRQYSYKQEETLERATGYSSYVTFTVSF